jgi:hypothetical protein
MNAWGRTFALACAATQLVAGCRSAPTAIQVPPPGGRHVLFIGNSLTMANDLPATVAAIAAAAGDTMRVATVAGPNLAAIDHVNGLTNAVATIRAGTWNFVVLQQGPTPAGVCRDTLILAARRFDPYVRAAGGKLALFMTWPTSAGSSAFFDQVRDSFREAADAVDGVFLPAGEAWRAAWVEDRSLPLYGPDGYHPSAMGSFLAALEIYERLSGRDARTLPAVAFSAGRPMTLPEATIRLLQAAAHKANAGAVGGSGGGGEASVATC